MGSWLILIIHSMALLLTMPCRLRIDALQHVGAIVRSHVPGSGVWTGILLKKGAGIVFAWDIRLQDDIVVDGRTDYSDECRL